MGANNQSEFGVFKFNAYKITEFFNLLNMNSQSATNSHLIFTDFSPKWWAKNAHIQTIIPSLFSSVRSPQVDRVEITTPDNDFLEIDICDLNNSNPIIALFHGFEGSSERYYIRNLMFDLQVAGFSSVALNFRGCGSKMNLQKRMYHSGETEDYSTLFTWIQNTFPQNDIFAVGFSLGGNALTKSLGELKSDHPIRRAVAVCPPYDLKEGSLKMHQGINRLYEERFLRTLRKKVHIKKQQFPDFPTFTGSSVYDFDDQITAAIHGFDSADHYYELSSSKHFLKEVKKPLLVIHSKEDPLCPIEFAPFSDIQNNSCLETLFTDKGGHVGFIGTSENWLNMQIIQWFCG